MAGAHPRLSRHGHPRTSSYLRRDVHAESTGSPREGRGNGNALRHKRENISDLSSFLLTTQTSDQQNTNPVLRDRACSRTENGRDGLCDVRKGRAQLCPKAGPIWLPRRSHESTTPGVTERLIARGGEWPVRVDEYVDGMVERWVQSACVLCSHGCGLEIGVRDGRIVGVRGQAGDRVNHGRLGPKGLYGWQANNAADRLTHPLVRRDGELREASWDEAMDLVVERSRELLATKGSAALGFYTSGQLFIEDYYTLALVARGGIGTNHLDGNTRLCTATAGQALKETFGCDGQPAGVHDLEYCDTILHVGINTAESQTVLWMHELDRLQGPDPPRSIVIDPRETQSAKAAEVHLAIRPGTNLAVLNGIAQQLIENDWVDQCFRGGPHGRDRGARENSGALHAREGCGDLPGGRRRCPPGGRDRR